MSGARRGKKKSLRVYFVLPRGAHPELFDLLDGLNKTGEAHQYARTLMILGFEARQDRLAKVDFPAETAEPDGRSGRSSAGARGFSDNPLGADLDELLSSYTR